MEWKFGIIAGALLMTGCDTRPGPVVYGEMRLHIRERCEQGLIESPEVVAMYRTEYCGCLVNRLTEGKSRSEIIQMEQNPALYMEPNEDIVRQCTAVARPGSTTSGAVSGNQGN